jgi:hypothetical protein
MLIIPGAIKEVPKPVVTQVTKKTNTSTKSNTSAQGGYTFTQ